MKNESLQIIGSSELVSIGKRAIDVPAKIDTGADSSSIWASNIRVGKDGILRFSLFGEKSKYYNGKIFKRTDYKVAVVRNANGHEQIRYRTHFKISIGDRKIKALFNLSDRSRNNFPILIGRRTIQGKFIVDVSKNTTNYPKIARTKKLNQELIADPYEFHKKHVKNMSGRMKK